MSVVLPEVTVLFDSDEFRDFEVTAAGDPTGGAVAFAVSSLSTFTPGAFDFTGSWTGAWNATSSTAVASFDYGASGLARGTYRLYISYIVGAEAPVKKPCAVLKVL